ncbi:MAG TPA: HD domain-containing protein, partial [Gemmatimonadales bacterium]|nr:HD domain-containing protein [Gemmatimonadales bacterium]
FEGAEDLRLRSVLRLLARFDDDGRHARHVAHLSLRLFDELGPLLGCVPSDRPLLETAALVHDVGQLVSYRRHHKHSFQLIMHADRLPLAPRDRLLVALVSRYHRKSGPKRKHEEYGALGQDEQALVRRLSAILRVADGLDRGHTAAVESVYVHVDDDRVTLRVQPRLAGADITLECWGASRKSDVMERLLDREVVVEPGA